MTTLGIWVLIGIVVGWVIGRVNDDIHWHRHTWSKVRLPGIHNTAPPTTEELKSNG